MGSFGTSLIQVVRWIYAGVEWNTVEAWEGGKQFMQGSMLGHFQI